jgi:dTDP-glucose 4,6-dehydratase
MLVLAWARTYGIKYLILRPTNNYGIGQYPEKLIPLAVKNLMRNKKIKLHDKGEPIRNWLHAEDTASAVTTLIESGVVNEIYNVAGGFEQKNIETIIKILESYFNEIREDGDWSEYLDLSYDREGQDVRYALNDQKLRALGWRAEKQFDQEIKNIVNFYKDNFKW